MSKKGIILSYVLLLAIFSTNFFYFLSVETPIGTDKQNNNKFNDSVAPKSSGYTITEKWNYTGSNLGDIVISLDGNYIALKHDTLSNDNLTLFNRNSNDTLWTTENFSDVDSFDISADGKYISVGSEDEFVYLFNNTAATPVWAKTSMWKYNVSTGDLVHVAISGDGKYTAAVSDIGLFLLDNTLQSKKWSYNTAGPEIVTVDIGYNPIQNRYYIAIGDDAGNVTLFDETSAVPLWWNDTTSSINDLKISDDGSHILAKNSDDEVYLFDNTVQTPKLALWNYSTSGHIGIDISADGKNMIVVEEDRVNYLNNTASITKMEVWEALSTFFNHDGVISGDGKYILVGGQKLGLPSEGKVDLYNNSKKLPKAMDWQESKGNDIPNVAINGFGNYFAIIDNTNVLHFYHHDVPLPRAIVARSGGGGDGDDDEEAAIPFGNYYLVFACVAIISLAVIIKRKVIFKTK